MAIAVDETLPVSEANLLTDRLRSELMEHMPALRTATVTLAVPGDTNVFEIVAHAHGRDDH